MLIPQPPAFSPAKMGYWINKTANYSSIGQGTITRYRCWLQPLRPHQPSELSWKESGLLSNKTLACTIPHTSQRTGRTRERIFGATKHTFPPGSANPTKTDTPKTGSCETRTIMRQYIAKKHVPLTVNTLFCKTRAVVFSSRVASFNAAAAAAAVRFFAMISSTVGIWATHRQHESSRDSHGCTTDRQSGHFRFARHIRKDRASKTRDHKRR